MSAFSSMPAAPQGLARRSLTSRFAASLRRLLSSYVAWRLERAAIAALRSMSDRELRDIGLNRSEIETAVKTEVSLHHSQRRFI